VTIVNMGGNKVNTMTYGPLNNSHDSALSITLQPGPGTNDGLGFVIQDSSPAAQSLRLHGSVQLGDTNVAGRKFDNVSSSLTSGSTTVILQGPPAPPAPPPVDPGSPLQFGLRDEHGNLITDPFTYVQGLRANGQLPPACEYHP